MRAFSTFWTYTTLVLPAFAQFPPLPEDTRCPALPADHNLTPLPNPFVFESGKPVRTKVDWACHRREISELIQRYGLGELPNTMSAVKGELILTESGTPKAINVTVTEGEKTIGFQSRITLPTEGEGPFPAIIVVGWARSIPEIPGVATIYFENDQIAQHSGTSSRGLGLFYDLYGANHSAGAMIAWAWGVGRLIDALQRVNETSGIDVRRLGVTGCSRNGKGALVIGAFEPRISLTIPQESGAGGAACWRIQDALMARGLSVQTASQIVRENVWQGKAFEAFTSKIGVLPYDQHLLAALVAPRALYTAENGAIDWLGPESTWGCQRAARTVWKAWGAEDRIGFAQTAKDAEHNHCALPDSHLPGLITFVDKFLKGKDVDTSSFFKTEAEFPQYTDKYWSRWETPKLQ